MKFRWLLTAALLSMGGIAEAQKLKKADMAMIASLREHVEFLASDALEGRRTGTPGEEKAAKYISAQFSKAGLEPAGDKDFEQEFSIAEGKMVDPSSFLFINGVELREGMDYFPLVFSAEGNLEAFPSMSLKESGVPWFVDVNDFFRREKEKNPHVDIHEAVRKLASSLHEKGATAIVFYESDTTEGSLKFEPKGKASPVTEIPVVVIRRGAVEKHLKDHEASYEIKLKVKLTDKFRKGRNVIGVINNNAPYTVVIGAHYDHLGYGEDGNSLLKSGPGIHNGADDNASGTSVLIELAKWAKTKELRSFNYVFAAFSGEELGLLGSRYFTEHLPLKDKPLNYMINMDMVGRLKSPENTVTVGGYGTSRLWEKLVLDKKDKTLSIKVDSSGSGPSDHHSFYRIKVPVLFFFTGTHEDYHKPSDDADKLNYHGMLLLEKKISGIVLAAEKEPKLEFLATRDKQMSAPGAFKVTMGIMPDYAYSGTGVRIDGISSGRPADKAGLTEGDIVIKLGDISIGGMDEYMKALGSFEKGMKVKVLFIRKGKEMSADLVW